MSDLERLIEAVEAGLDTAHHHAAVFPSESAYGHCTWHDSHKASTEGSLDAALRLHEALLPGWVVNSLDQASNLAGDPWGCEVAWFEGSNPSNNRRAYSGHNFDKNPARAWLLAILRAIKAKGDA